MPDPITSIVTVISEHPQTAAAVASIYGVAKPFLAKILGPGAEELGEIGRDYVKGKRAENANRTLADAATLLATTGREAQPVPLKIAVPLLDAASLEEEPTLVDKWAALLANAADPAQPVQVLPAFVEVLSQLSTDDAQVLLFIHTAPGSAAEELPDKAASPLPIEGVFSYFQWAAEKVELSLDNLLRLRLVEVLTQATYGPTPELSPGSLIRPNAFGRQFLAACTPPTAL